MRRRRERRRRLCSAIRERVVSEPHGSQARPRMAVARNCDSDLGPFRPERRVRHHVRIEARNECHPRILAAVTARLGTEFVRRFRLQHDTDALEDWAVRAVATPGDADARYVPRRDHPRIHQQRAASVPRDCRIENAGGLVLGPVRREHDPATAVGKLRRLQRAALRSRRRIFPQRRRRDGFRSTPRAHRVARKRRDPRALPCPRLARQSIPLWSLP